MPSNLTAFSIKQWLLQRLFAALAVQRTSQSHLETEESLCPIPLATQLQDSKLCLDGRSLSSGSNCRNLFAINTGDQKGEGEEHSKKALSIPQLEGYGRMVKTSFPARKDMITFNCKLFSVSYPSCLSANEAGARISSTDLRWWHTSMAAD